MKFFKIDLLTLLISLFLFASCETTSTIGLEIDPENKIEGLFVDSLTVSSRTIMEENAATRTLGRYPVAYLKDPVMGVTEASIAMSLGLPSPGYSFGTAPILDSAILVLNYIGEFYGDSTQNYSFQVNQLTNNLSNDDTFMSNKVYPFESTVIGTKTGRLYPTTKLTITDVLPNLPDTLKSVSPQIRIKLDANFIQNNILNLNAATLKNDGTFKNAFRGLHVKMNNPTGNGAIMFFDLSTIASNLSLYYKKKNDTDAAKTDTVNVNFQLGNNANAVASSMKHNYTGTPVETQLNNPNQQFSVTYLQPLAGLRNKIAFPSLKTFGAGIGKMMINKAELVIDLAPGSDLNPFEAAPRLALYRYDIAEQRVHLPDNSPATDIRGLESRIFGGYYNPVTRQYVFVVTSYIQDLLNGRTEDYGTFLAPAPIDGTNDLLRLPALSSAARSIIGAHKKNANPGEANMKLNLYYTKVN
ncbi:MAG: DUF4270 family protein [Pedobacter sp.]|nr:MAG: DUF4270 family protein [Pedobacter sp.]